MFFHTVNNIVVKAFDVIAQVLCVLKLIPGRTKVVDMLLSSSQFKAIFDEGDVNSSGSLSPEEVYILVLRLYILVAQYSLVVARQVPTKDDVKRYIKGKDGVSFEEFKSGFLLLSENIVFQLCAQLIFTLFLSPLLAMGIIFALKQLFFLFPYFLAQFWFIPSMFCNEQIGLLCFAATLNMLLVPYYLDYVFYIQKLRSPEVEHFVPDMKQFQPVPLSLSPLKLNTSPSPSPSLSPRASEVAEVVQGEEVVEVEKHGDGHKNRETETETENMKQMERKKCDDEEEEASVVSEPFKDEASKKDD